MKEKSIKRRAKELDAIFPRPPMGILSPFKPGESYSPGANGRSPMKKGNRLAAKENLTEEAHAKRQSALFMTWHNKVRRTRGERIMTHEAKKKARVTKRRRARDRLVLEQRDMQIEMRKSAPDAVEAVNKILANPASRDADKLAAAQVIFDRAYGKANQTNTNVNVDANGKRTEVSTKELEERIEHSLKRIEELTGEPARGQVRAAEKKESKEGPADICERNGNTGGTTLH